MIGRQYGDLRPDQHVIFYRDASRGHHVQAFIDEYALAHRDAVSAVNLEGGRDVGGFGEPALKEFIHERPHFPVKRWERIDFLAKRAASHRFRPQYFLEFPGVDRFSVFQSFVNIHVVRLSKVFIHPSPFPV